MMTAVEEVVVVMELTAVVLMRRVVAIAAGMICLQPS
jgi:hypothetical protein